MFRIAENQDAPCFWKTFMQANGDRFMTSTNHAHGTCQITITHLDPSDWQAFKLIRLESLATDPQAFMASYDESHSWSEPV